MNNEEQYHLLIKARNFHYDNFNKWMTFFYVAVGAIFVGYYSIVEKTELNFEKIIILSIGLLVSIFWHWSCKGYYYWITNFIQLIQLYEEKMPPMNRVYFCMVNKASNNNYCNPVSGANISTSKITLLFSFIVTFSWSLLLTNKIIHINKLNIIWGKISILFYCISFVITYIILVLIPYLFLQSDISNYPELKNR
ncbi:RipA family octameric membrane protein [Treponema pectinovorum]|uniref:RipA family octameric membrane protein n=1 Tax=Treponema pectinovorum TaxID=164 RepID=UPI0011CAB7E5|nr:hypothetical protein [Treponema pectinovorum]